MNRSRTLLALFVLAMIMYMPLTMVVKSNTSIKPEVQSSWTDIQISVQSVSDGTHSLLKPEWALVGSDPLTYRGPIVEGWPPGKSRDMSQIMAKDYVVDHCQEQDLSGVKLLVGVKSVSNRFETRDTTRETWGLFQNDHPDVKVLFFTGEPSNPLTINRLRAEIQVHCDLVVVRGVDSYANRTIKAVSLLRYVNDHHLGLNPEVTMVMDDDAYLNLDRLYYLISHRLLATAVDNFITGFVYGGPVLRPPVNSTDQFVKPSVCPSYMYNGTTTPPHLSGSGYLMPRATVPCLVRQAMSLPFLHINDVFITGFCAEACGFPRVAHSQFSPGKKKLEDITCHHILLHYQSPEARLKIFNKFVKECPSPNK